MTEQKHPYIRDSSSGALINNDKEALALYKSSRDKLKKQKQFEEETDIRLMSLEQKMDRILSLLEGNS